jgi:hypothetical protein
MSYLAHYESHLVISRALGYLKVLEMLCSLVGYYLSDIEYASSHYSHTQTNISSTAYMAIERLLLSWSSWFVSAYESTVPSASSSFESAVRQSALVT